MRPVALFATAAALASACLASDRDFNLTATPLFEGMTERKGCTPYLISVSNQGDSTGGVVHIENNSFQMDYPLELPRGAVKQFIAYPPSSGLLMDSTEVSLGTPNGGASVRVNGHIENGAQRSILLIGNNPGLLNFLRQTQSGQQGMPQQNDVGDCYARPGALPDRAYGYSGVSLIMLGEGSERMRNAEVNAIKDWVVTGGTIMFVGGASSPVLSDPRWRALIPVRKLRLTNQSRVEGFEPYYLPGTGAGFSKSPAGPVTLQVGNRVDGAKAEIGDALVSKRIGVGKSLYLAFDPFEQPVRTWPNRRNLFVHLMNMDAEQRQWAALGAAIVPESSPVQRFGPPFLTPTQTDDSPFSAKLPPTGTIALILISYLVVVVPINFLLLRKLRMGERAWVTAPLISLAFAGGIFTLAGGLYQHGLTTSVHGLILVAAEAPDAVFVGKARLFFPRGGSYDLGMRGVDSIEAQSPFTLPNGDPYSYYYSGNNSATFERLNAMDVGEVRIANLAATNLNFKEFWFRQRVPVHTWLRSDLKLTRSSSKHGKGIATISGTIYNDSPYTISETFVYYGAFGVAAQAIAPHSKIELSNVKTTHTRGSFTPDQEQNSFWTADGQCAVYGRIEGFRPGPQIGTVAEEPGALSILCFMLNGAGQ